MNSFLLASAELLRRATLLCRSVVSPATGEDTRVVAAWPDCNVLNFSILWARMGGQLVGTSISHEVLSPDNWDEVSILELAVDVGEPIDPARYSRDTRTGIWWAKGDDRTQLGRLDLAGIPLSRRLIERAISMPSSRVDSDQKIVGVWPVEGCIEVATIGSDGAPFCEFELASAAAVDRFSLDWFTGDTT